MKYILSLALLIFSYSSVFAQLNVVVVLDASGSMDATFSGDRNITRMDAAKKALVEVISALPENSKVGIVVLPYEGWVYPLDRINKKELKDKINSIDAAGGTPLGQYMTQGANALIELRKEQKYGSYKLLVVTDGESTDDAETPLTGQYGILAKGLHVEAIGVDMNRSHSLATKVPYRSAKNPKELVTAVKEVLAESTGGHSEDYDIIAPLDPKLAMAALQALTQVDNTPVGMKPKLDENGNVMIDANGNVIVEKAVSVSNGSAIAIWIIGIVVMLVVGIIVFVLLNRN